MLFYQGFLKELLPTPSKMNQDLMGLKEEVMSRGFPGLNKYYNGMFSRVREIGCLSIE